MAWYEVKVTAFATVLVQADSEDKALDAFEHDFNFGDLVLEQAIAKIETNVETARRFADRVIETATP